MYVCVCRAFNEDAIREVAEKCSTVSELFRELGGRPSCGKCISAVRDIAYGCGDSVVPSTLETGDGMAR